MNHALLDLQEIDNALTALAREKSRLDNGSLVKAELDRLVATLAHETSVNQKANADRNDRELELKSAEEKLAKQSKRMMSATSAHEIAALQRDIEGLGRARSELDEGILTLMDEVDQSDSRVKNLEDRIAATRTQLATVEAKFAADTKRNDIAVHDRKKEREGVVQRLSADELAVYDRFAKQHQGVACTRVVKGNCSGCGAVLLPFTLKEAKTQEYPQCDGCGRLIFVD